MRIRTTRQAREIRKGIMLARDPRPITPEDIGGHLYQFPLIQRAYQRTRNRPPKGEQGNIRAPHPGWKVCDETACNPAGEGHVYINKESAERMGTQSKPGRITE